MNFLLSARGPLGREISARSPLVFRRCMFAIGKKKPKSGKYAVEFPARTRFAPSPTGSLHIGSLRTALYNYALARKTGGQFVLRLEDTDRNRLVKGAEKEMMADLKWAGLDWDEGPDNGGPFAPYKQSERLETYRQHIDILLEKGHAYRCFCKHTDTPPQDQEPKDEDHKAPHAGYPGTCSHISKEESDLRAKTEKYCVRFQTHDNYVSWRDNARVKHTSRPDNHFVILKQDGYPTYHFANVVDDHLMEITHVIRGVEWNVSTAMHVAIYQAFDWHPPMFVHVGLLMDKNGQKFSKRRGGNMRSFRDKGYLPATVLNYAMLLGWSAPKVKRVAGEVDVLTLDDIVKKFRLKFTKGNIVVNDKIDWLQAKHTSRLLELGDLSVQENVLPLLAAEIQRIDSRNNGSKSPESLPLFVSDIDTLVPRIQGLAQQDDKWDQKAELSRTGMNRALVRQTVRGNEVEQRKARELAQQYLGTIINAEPRFSTTDEFLERNHYLIWGITPEASERGLHETLFADGFTRLTMEDQFTGSDKEVSLRMVLRDLRDSMQKIKTDDLEYWKKENIIKALHTWSWRTLKMWPPATPVSAFSSTSTPQPTGEAEPARSTEEEEPVPPTTGGGETPSVVEGRKVHWALLRWVILAGKPGQGIVPVMELIGPTETLDRIAVATEVAKKLGL